MDDDEYISDDSPTDTESSASAENNQKTPSRRSHKISVSFDDTAKGGSRRGPITSQRSKNMKPTPHARNSVSFMRPTPIQPPGTPTAKRQKKAQEALDKLQFPSCEDGQNGYTQYTPDHARMLAQNIGVVLDAASVADRDKEATAIQAANLLKRTQLVKNGVASKTGTSHETSSLKKRKKTSADRGLDDSSSDDGSPTADRGLKPHGRRTKRLRPSKNVQVIQTLDDVAAFQPIQIIYPPHPLEERTDDWFVTMFSRLYHRAEFLVSHYFTLQNLDQGEFYQPWSINMTPEFLAWAEQVAEPDPTDGSWDRILRDASQRKWFIMAILAKVLKVKVFDTNLFGANQQEAELLHGLDRAFLAREG